MCVHETTPVFTAAASDSLLETFSQYVDHQILGDDDAWHSLDHLCQRWRCVVFASPCHLILRLVCTNRRPVKSTLDFWLELPIVAHVHNKISRVRGMTNVIAALKQHSRVCKIRIGGVRGDVQTFPSSCPCGKYYERLVMDRCSLLSIRLSFGVR